MSDFKPGDRVVVSPPPSAIGGSLGAGTVKAIFEFEGERFVAVIHDGHRRVIAYPEDRVTREIAPANHSKQDRSAP
jgi:hypothetical protein